MKKFGLLFLLIPFFSLAQFGGGQNIQNPVKWHTSVEKTGNDTYNLIFEADIEKGWHVYSQFNDPMGSMPIEFEWKNAKNNYEVIGKAKEFNTHKAYSEGFKVTETFFSNHAKLSQPIKAINKNLKKIDVTLFGQTCKQSCIPIEKELSFDLTKAKLVTTADTGKQGNDNKNTGNNKKTDTKNEGVNNSSGVNTIQNNNNTKKDISEAGKYTDVPLPAKDLKGQAENIKEASAEPEKEPINKWNAFWIAFLAGLIVLLTPCVFPMIPLTISFFTKQSEKAGANGKINAIVYALSIIFIYVAISIPFHIWEKADPGVFNNFATNTTVNLIFFSIFLLFALNLFGVEKLDPVRLMPNSLVNSADNKSSKGGLMAGFFMALVLVIVSFSCTGPALGLIIGNVMTNSDGPMILTFALLGFGLGIALPFGLLAFFPSLLQQLPQSGGWLNTVKVIFGFIELAFAFKFLSNADLVNQWHFLHREVFLAIWIGIAFTMAMYLFGKIRLPHDAPLENISVFRFLFGMSTLIFGLYLLPGLWGAPLNIISGFPPPMKYAESKFGVGNTQRAQITTKSQEKALPEGAEYGPNNIVIFEDYDLAMAYAKKVNKPLMLDFTGRACQNCRLMEEKVWSQDEILPILNNEVVLVSLFVDDRTELPKDKHYVSKYSGKKVTTVGKKWTELETFVYKNNSQPLYIIIDHDENKLSTPVGYTPEVSEYKTWLRKGIDRFKK